MARSRPGDPFHKNSFGEIVQDIGAAERRLETFNKAMEQLGNHARQVRLSAELERQFDRANARAAMMMRTIREGRMNANFGRAGEALEKVKEKLQGVSNVARTTFLSITGGVTGVVAAASPDTMKTFTDSFRLLSASIGQAFIPYIAKAAAWLQRLSAWFRRLSPEMKEKYARWVMIAGGVAGVVMILPKLVAAAQAATVAVQGLGKAFNFMAQNAKIAVATAGMVAFARLGQTKAEMDERYKQIGENAKQRDEEGFDKDELNDPVARRLLAIKDHNQRLQAAAQERAKLRKRFEEYNAKENTGVKNFLGNYGDALETYTGGFIPGGGPNRRNREKLEEFVKQGQLVRKIAEAAQRGQGVEGLRKRGRAAQEELLLSMANQQASYSGLADMHKQAQLSVLNKSPLEEEILQINRESKEQLVNIAKDTRQMASKPDPQPAIGR